MTYPSPQRRLRVLCQVPEFASEPSPPRIPKVLLLFALFNTNFGYPLSLHFLLASRPFGMVFEGTAWVQQKLVNAPVRQVVKVAHGASVTHAVKLSVPELIMIHCLMNDEPITRKYGLLQEYDIDIIHFHIKRYNFDLVNI